MMHRSSPLPCTAALILAVALIAGCQSPVPSFATHRASGESDVPYATNIVHVPRDARFSLVLEAFNPADSGSIESDLSGKDRWLLMRIRTLSANATPQLESQHIVRAALVKAGLRSFGTSPLSLDEVPPVSLEANTDYEVDVRLYEMKAPQRASRANHPGVSLERQLRDAGGTLRLEARFAIYRSDDILAPRRPDDDLRGRTSSHHYQLTPSAYQRTAAGYLERLQLLENPDAPDRQNPFLRFRIESMWSPVAMALAQLPPAPAMPEAASEEQATAAEALAASTRETFLKVSEDEKQASLAAAEALRKSDSANSVQWTEIARELARKTQAVAAARSAMEAAQLRAREARQSLEAVAARATRIANAEKIAALAAASLDNVRRTTEAAAKDLADANAALQHTRATAETARLKNEEWRQTEARAQSRLTNARTQLATLTLRVKKSPGDAGLRRKLSQVEQQISEAAHAADAANSEWKLAQKDQETKLKEVEARIDALAQKRTALAGAEQERQRALAAKDDADALLSNANAADPRPAILHARSL